MMRIKGMSNSALAKYAGANEVLPVWMRLPVKSGPAAVARLKRLK
jgi:hypothetical protein